MIGMGLDTVRTALVTSKIAEWDWHPAGGAAPSLTQPDPASTQAIKAAVDIAVQHALQTRVTARHANDGVADDTAVPTTNAAHGAARSTDAAYVISQSHTEITKSMQIVARQKLPSMEKNLRQLAVVKRREKERHRLPWELSRYYY